MSVAEQMDWKIGPIQELLSDQTQALDKATTYPIEERRNIVMLLLCQLFHTGDTTIGFCNGLKSRLLTNKKVQKHIGDFTQGGE